MKLSAEILEKYKEALWQEWTGYLEMWFDHYHNKNKTFKTEDLIAFIKSKWYETKK